MGTLEGRKTVAAEAAHQLVSCRAHFNVCADLELSIGLVSIAREQESALLARSDADIEHGVQRITDVDRIFDANDFDRPHEQRRRQPRQPSDGLGNWELARRKARLADFLTFRDLYTQSFGYEPKIDGLWALKHPVPALIHPRVATFITRPVACNIVDPHALRKR